MWKWLLFLNGLILSAMMPPLAAVEPARHLRITRPRDRTGGTPEGPRHLVGNGLDVKGRGAVRQSRYGRIRSA